MAKLHFISPTAPMPVATTVRFGATGAANNYTTKDEGKPVKLAAESQFDLCAVGNEIEGYISSVETGTSGGFSVGGVVSEGAMNVTLDGLQATPGTGVVALGDYVVAGTIVARGTALTAFPKVCKATPLTFATTPAVDFPAGAHLNFKWRVVSLGTAGTGAVGTSAVIKRVA